VQRAGSCAPANVSCVDADVRAYYTTSALHGGRPLALTRWRVYDPRVRPWYTNAKARWADAAQVLRASRRSLGLRACAPAAVQRGAACLAPP
jgi:hypothetical protein